MKLEVGKYYKTRNGDKVFLRETDVAGCAGFGEPYGLYLPDGKFGYIENGRHLGACPDLDIVAEWTDTPEVGTLKEIGAQHGDVVQWVSSDKLIPGHKHVGKTHTIQSDGRVLLDGGDGEYWGIIGEGDECLNVNWRIISRAKPGPVRTVTRQEIVPGVYGVVDVASFATKEMAAVMIAQHWTKLDGSKDVGHACLSADELTDAIATLTAIRDAMQAGIDA